MEYCGGVKNVRIAVGEVINKQIKIKANPVPEINAIRSVIYSDQGMTIRKASNVGLGQIIPYSNLQAELNMKLTTAFTSFAATSDEQKRVERRDRQMTSFYFCLQDNCVLTFNSEDELTCHILSGSHLTIDDRLNVYDKAKIQLFDKLRDAAVSTTTTTALDFLPSTVTTAPVLPQAHLLASTKTLNYFNTGGWALKVQKPRRPIDPLVKTFIKSVMDEEKLYGTKFLEKEYIRRIRTARKDDGSKLFQPFQYLKASQVSSLSIFFSNDE